MEKTEVIIGKTKYTSLCQNCTHKPQISHVRTPRSNADVMAKIPALEQYYCPAVHTDLVYLPYGDNQVMMDVAECSQYKPVEITGEDIRKKKATSKK